jgi:hypothetical protein
LSFELVFHRGRYVEVCVQPVGGAKNVPNAARDKASLGVGWCRNKCV